MATAEIFKTELTSMQSLLQQQSAIVTPEDLTQLITVQCDAFIQKIATISDIDVPAIVDLTSVIESGCWTGEQKGRLIMALNARLSSGATAPKNGSKRQSQEIMSFHRWTVQEEAVAIIAPDVAFSTKINVICQVMKRMGLVGASERSKAHIMKILMAACVEFMKTLDADTAWKLYQELKRKIHLAFKNNKSPGRMGYIVEYPDDPNHLPKSQFDVIFNGKTPVTLSFVDQALNCADELLSMRGNNGKLTQNVKTSPMLQLQSQSPQQQLMSNPFFMQMANAFAPMMRQGGLSLPFFPGASADPSAMLPRKRTLCELEDCNAGPAMQQQLALTDGGHVQGQLAQQGQQPALQDPQPDPSTPKKHLKNLAAGAETTLSPSEQAERFMTAMKGGKAPAEVDDGQDDEEEDDDDDDDDGADPAMKKPASKTAAAKAAAKTAASPASKTAAAKAAAKTAAKKGIVFNPKVELEKTRDQWLFRPGVSVSVGGESNCTFKFEDFGGKAKAEKAAKAHLVAFRASHKCK